MMIISGKQSPAICFFHSSLKRRRAYTKCLLNRRFLAFAEADREIDDRADKRNQRNKPPQRFFFDTAEILPCDIDNSPAGGQKKDNAGPDDNRYFAQADSFSSLEILKIAFT